MMRHIWTNYEERAWGRDELKPLSGTGEDTWGGLGMTLVDALDTLWLMGFREEFDRAVGWVEQNLTYGFDINVNLFETTIRQLGGLLAAYTLSKRPVLLDRARDLGDRLLVAFATPKAAPVDVGQQPASGGAERMAGWMRKLGLSGEALAKKQPQSVGDSEPQERLPFSDVNLGTGEVQNLAGYVSLAEAYVPLEWKTLTLFTGNCSYAAAQDKVLKIVNESLQLETRGLAPILVTPEGKGLQSPGNCISLGSRGDSFYEYLLKDAVFSSAGPKSTVRRLWSAFRKALPGLFVEVDPHALEAGPRPPVFGRAHRRRRLSKAVLQRSRRGRRLKDLWRGAGGARGGWFEDWTDVRGNWLFLKEVGETRTIPKIDHLVCFLPGALALDVMNGVRPLQGLADLVIGNSVRIADDSISMLAACRRAGLPIGKDHARTMALGMTVQVLRKDMRDGTVLVSAPDVSKVWLPFEALELPSEARRNFTSRSSVGNVTSLGDEHLSELLLAHKLVQTCVHMYFRTVTDLAPEITRFNAWGLIDDLGSMHHILRPETIESVFVLWRTTKAQIYRNWGQRLLSAFARTKSSYGFTSLNNVNKPSSQRNEMPSFFVAETIKYLYLLFSEDEALDLRSFVLGTEAHPMPTVAASGLPWPCDMPVARRPPEQNVSCLCAEDGGGAVGQGDAHVQEELSRWRSMYESSRKREESLRTELRSLKAEVAACSRASSAEEASASAVAAAKLASALGPAQLASLRDLLLKGGEGEGEAASASASHGEAVAERSAAGGRGAIAIRADAAPSSAASPLSAQILEEPSEALATASASAVAPAAEATFRREDSSCWVGAFSFETCCLPAPAGNPQCWDGVYTFARCCAGGAAIAASL